MRASLLIPFLIMAFVLLPFTSARAAIFGEDGRANLTPDSPFASLGAATAISVLSTIHNVNARGKLDVDSQSLSFLCSDQAFVKDPSITFACSGFLVAPNLLVTAGHCASNFGEVKNEPEGYCKVYDWLFDYQATSSGPARTTDLDPANLYHCKRIVYAIQAGEAPNADFALIELDRNVTGRTPLKIAEAAAGLGDSLFMIGYPLGTPMKITSGARVLSTRSVDSTFLTNLDAFEGNSGSAVLNGKNEVVGILVSGTPATYAFEDPVRKCSVYNRCDDDGRNCLVNDAPPDSSSGRNVPRAGSDVQKIAPLIEWIKAAQKPPNAF